LLAVVQEPYLQRVSTRKVDDMVKALGVDGISMSEVSRIRAALEAAVVAYRSRSLNREQRYLLFDATGHNVRVYFRVVSQATIVAVGITGAGDRQVLGVNVSSPEERASWTAFLRSPVKRGRQGGGRSSTLRTKI